MFQLGSIILLNPKSFRRQFLEVKRVNETVAGALRQKVTNRKEKFVLKYLNLNQAEVQSILSEYNQDEVRTFTVDEDNLSISATDVFVDIQRRSYVSVGNEVREDLELILTEVQ